MLQRCSVVLLLILLGACSSTPLDLSRLPPNSRYCDRYFIYRMCAQDLSGDGAVDALYFEDTKEVFLYKPESKNLVVNNLALHRCVQVMDDGISAVSDQLLQITEDTSFFQKADIKAKLMAHYLRYAPKIQKCNEALGIVQTEQEDDFGDFGVDDSETE